VIRPAAKIRIINSVLGDARGGRWRVVCDYCCLLSRRGHPVSLLLSRQHVPALTALPSGVEVRFIRNHGHYDYMAAWRLRAYLKAWAPDLAIAHCSRSVALLKRALAGSAPVLAVSHSPKVKRLLPADACIALTADIRARFEGAGTGKPCFVVPNMIPVRAARQAPEPRGWHQPVRLGALGRFDPVKGFDVFIEALGELLRVGRDFSAVLGGAGPAQQALQTRARALGLSDRLSFPGWVEDVDAFLAEVDILCVPARSDAFGLTPLQAARAGTALVLSTASGHRAMFEADTQALFAGVDDAVQTARQIQHLMDNPRLAEQLRWAAFERVRTCYSEPVVGDQLLQVVNKVIKCSSM